MITKFSWLLIGSISINTILISTSLFSQEVESGKQVASTPSGKHEGGYLLMAPLGSTDVQLLDRDGESIHHWKGKHRPGHSVYLLDDGSLLRTGSLGRRGAFGFQGGGLGGVVEKVSWTGEVSWSLDWASEKHISHHDIEPLPNGNFLMIAWEKKNKEECLAVGRHPALLPRDEMWVDAILEIHPTGKSGGEVVNATVSGNVFKIVKNPLESVQLDEVVIILESMKMEIEIVSPHSGQVKDILVKEGDIVQEGDALFSIG
jgi:biotin carboxyl carrier protein